MRSPTTTWGIGQGIHVPAFSCPALASVVMALPITGLALVMSTVLPEPQTCCVAMRAPPAYT